VLEAREKLVELGHPEAIDSPMRPAIPRGVVLGILAALTLCALIWLAIKSMHAA
jgi:hypothetical protein